MANPPPPDVLAAGDDADARARRVPGWLWRTLGGIAVAGSAALFVPGLLASTDDAAPGPDATSTPSLPPLPPESPRPPAPLDWDTRGDLADDEAFLSASLARVRELEPPAKEVLFAGALPDGSRLAIVALARSDPVSDLGRGVHTRALFVPKGSAIRDAVPKPLGALVEQEDLVAWAGRVTDGRIHAVILGRPAPFALEASPLIHYHRDGEARRRWQLVTARDGAAVADLGRRSDQVIVVRSAEEDRSFYPMVIDVAGDPRSRSAVAPTPDVADVEGLGGGSYRGPDPKLVVRALAIAHEHRFEPHRADLRVIWSGQLEPGRRGAVVRARRPDGPTFQLLVIQGPNGVSQHGPRHVPWETADVTPWLYVQGDRDEPVLLLSPSGRGIAQVGVPGAVFRNVDINDDGIGVLEGSTQGAMFTGLSGDRVVVLSPEGEIISSTSLAALGVDDVYVLR